MSTGSNWLLYNCATLRPQLAKPHNTMTASTLRQGSTADDKWAEKVAATVVLRADQELSERQLLDLEAELKERVKKQKGPVQSPKMVEFIEKIPVTALGKVDKKSLRAPFWGASKR